MFGRTLGTMPGKSVFNLAEEKTSPSPMRWCNPRLAIWLFITLGSLASRSSIRGTIEAAHTISLGTTGEDYFLEAMLCFLYK